MHLKINDMKLYGYLGILLLALCSSACVQENLIPGLDDVSGPGLSLSVQAQGLSEHKVTTRGSDVKNADESAINSLHIFLFDQSGEYLTYNGKPACLYVGSNTTPKIVQAAFSDLNKAETATIYAVANVEKRIFADNNDDGKPDAFPNLAALQDYTYTPEDYTQWAEIPDADGDGVKDMPMVGMEAGKDLTVASGVVEVKMKALMARVDMNITLKSEYVDVANNYPQLSLTRVQMLNVPKSVRFTAPLDGDTTELGDELASFSASPQTKVIYNGNGEYTFTYYVFENLQQPKDYTYPTGIKDSDKQAHKPLRAKDKATNFSFTGEYIDYHGSKYTATYTLFLGSNHTDNFEVKRNFQYKNNIVVTGLTKSKLPGQHIPEGGTVDIYGFDARVDVVLSSTKFYVSVFNERDIDAHASIVPMDIYTDGNPVTISVVNPTEDSWVRMEYVSPETMKNANYKTFTGVRDYFTHDLVTNTLKDNHTISNCGNRSRVYFYIDENVAIINDNLDPAPTREAQICISSGDVKKYVTLRQPGLKKVVFKKTNREWGRNYEYQYTLYIEEYEEYTDYYDPLDVHNNTNTMYEGLPWGASGESIGGATDSDYDSDVYINGPKKTNQVLNHGVSDRKYTTKPLTAAEYCNNKNKRNANGSTNTSGGIWYLPAISELEAILTTYYSTFTEFQNYYYWSAAPGKHKTTAISVVESIDYARATKVIKNGNSFTYAESYDSDWIGYAWADRNDYGCMWESHASNKGGYARRTQPLRIRAAYAPNDGRFFSDYGDLDRTHSKRTRL